MKSISVQFIDDAGVNYSIDHVIDVRVVLRRDSKRSDDIASQGWYKYLDRSGSRYLVVKINGIIDCALADKLLLENTMNNTITEFVIRLSDHNSMRASFAIESYERYYGTDEFDTFSLILGSSGMVEFKEDL